MTDTGDGIFTWGTFSASALLTFGARCSAGRAVLCIVRYAAPLVSTHDIPLTLSFDNPRKVSRRCQMSLGG